MSDEADSHVLVMQIVYTSPNPRPLPSIILSPEIFSVSSPLSQEKGLLPPQLAADWACTRRGR